MLNKIILASKSEVRKEILDKNNIENDVVPSNVDEDVVKISLLKERASPEIISKNLAELKANKGSIKKIDKIAFIRFASVYRQFKDIGEFQTQIEDLKD